MRDHIWRSVLIVCLLQGLATATSPYAGMLAGLFIGIYLACRLWFVDHPVVWGYDLMFCAILLGTALVGAGIYAGICAVLPFTGVTTRACQSLGFERALWLHLWMLGLIGGGFWLSIRLWTWWKLRRS
ncbi:MAG: hypothetical protein ONB14_12925 [candidate division KSB1 bacterium]|nr:hypothetical protein [candidate division KSB1 bacterium]